MSNTPDILPDSRLTTVVTPKGAKHSHLGYWIPIYCANCGADGGMVPEENMTFAFYLCNSCYEIYGAIAGTMVEPDAVFHAKVVEAQLEKYGRVLAPSEMANALTESHHPLAILARDNHHSSRR